MKEKGNFKEFLKKGFSEIPKAKVFIGLLSIVSVSIIAIVIIFILRKTVHVNIDGNETTYVTYKSTVEEVLKDNGVEIASKDKIEPSLETKIKENQTITIDKAVPVKITMANRVLEVKTTDKKIGDMLNDESDFLSDQGFDINGDDIVNPSKDSDISGNMNIAVTKVEIENVVENQPIPFATNETIDYDKDISYNAVAVQGVNGEKEVTYKVVKHDGKIIDKQEVSQKPVKEAVDQVNVKGGSEFVASRGGEMIKVKKKLSMESTAYTGDKNTATGVIPVRSSEANGLSVIAVDPRVIPLGSLVYVNGYGKAIAADTGGLIKGNIIDVFLDSESECEVWGRKYGVEVGIIAYPGEW